MEDRGLYSIDAMFMPPATAPDAIAALRGRLRRCRGPEEYLAVVTGEPFDAVGDVMRATVNDYLSKGEPESALWALRRLDEALENRDTDSESLLHASVMQVAASVHLELGDTDQAAFAAARALHLLAARPKRKDAAFLVTLGSLLYDIARLHSIQGEHKQASREIEKAVRIFERLAKSDPGRFAAPHLAALDAATTVYANRRNQAELLENYQRATSEYQKLVEAGVEDAPLRLAESLALEADTLARMGKHREAMQYYTRALKYLTSASPEFGLTHLRLSIALGEQMLKVGNMRDKGVHLLNTMLHKATKCNALDEHRRIVDTLYHAKSGSLDILSLWHKMFPK